MTTSASFRRRRSISPGCHPGEPSKGISFRLRLVDERPTGLQVHAGLRSSLRRLGFSVRLWGQLGQGGDDQLRLLEEG